MDTFRPPLLASNPKTDDWKFFKRQMANFLVIVAAGADQKLPLLLNSLGRDGLDVYDGLPEPKETYEKAIERFDAHFECRQSILLKRKAFFNARQGANESSTDFACRLRRLVRECGFDSAQLTLLRDILFAVSTTTDLEKDSLRKTLPLSRLRLLSQRRRPLSGPVPIVGLLFPPSLQ